MVTAYHEGGVAGGGKRQKNKQVAGEVRKRPFASRTVEAEPSPFDCYQQISYLKLTFISPFALNLEIWS